MKTNDKLGGHLAQHKFNIHAEVYNAKDFYKVTIDHKRIVQRPDLGIVQLITGTSTGTMEITESERQSWVIFEFGGLAERDPKK